MPEVTVPLNFAPRQYQLEFLRELYNHKRAVQVWHRRAGKDLTDFIYTITQAFNRVGNYWHVFPEYKQGRKAIWEAKTKDGRPYLSYIPKEVIKRQRDNEMYIEFVNGSNWQVVGGDNVDSVVGAGPVGVVLSEWSLQRPSTWHYIEPMLLENDGWALFNFTPRGENHAKELFDMAKANPKWLTSLLTIDDTKTITLEQIEELRREGRPEEFIQQEFYCSFKSPLIGSYYGDILRELEVGGKITTVPYMSEGTVRTYWDVGFSDYTSIWFVQKIGLEYRLIDFYQSCGKTMDEYAKVLRGKGYNYVEHILPHDADSHKTTVVRDTEAEALEKLMPGTHVTTQKVTRSEQKDIMATRAFMRRCMFDAVKCEDGIASLKGFTKKWNDQRQCFDDKPAEGWANHGADAFRYFAMHNAHIKDIAEDFDYDHLADDDMQIKVVNNFRLSDF